MHRAAHALKSNIKVLNSLVDESRDIQPHDSPDLVKKYELFRKTLKSIVREQTFLQSQVELVCDRAERMSLMVRMHSAEPHTVKVSCPCSYHYPVDLLQFSVSPSQPKLLTFPFNIFVVCLQYLQLRDAMALRDNDIMKRLSRLTVSEGDLMLGLTEKTIREARTVKTITLVTLLYLPASFTSVGPCSHSLPLDFFFVLYISYAAISFNLCRSIQSPFCRSSESDHSPYLCPIFFS